MGHVEIDTERCKGCGLCVAMCPKAMLSLSPTFNRRGYHPAGPTLGADPSTCTGCAVCGRMCPDTAVTVYA
jgi:2-oxoglutarate ferredoxin oxidoreductase subunit delta